MTKLETLKTILEIQGSEEETITKLILDYYNNSDSSSFDTLEGIFYIYDYNEVKDELYIIARNQYDELYKELEFLIRKGSSELEILVDNINKDYSLDDLMDTIDYMSLEEKNIKFITEENGYYIYKED